MNVIFKNTINEVVEALAAGKRTVKAIAATCSYFEAQTNNEYEQSVFARLSDCKTRKAFAAVIESIDFDIAPVSDVEAAHVEAIQMDRNRTAWRLESDFYGSNDFAQRRMIVEAAHAEALAMNVTKACMLADIYNAARIKSFDAAKAFETILNVHLNDLVSVNTTHREMFFKDGSILMVMDIACCVESGLSQYAYSFKYQDSLY